MKGASLLRYYIENGKEILREGHSMTKQPEALNYADYLEGCDVVDGANWIRRLYAENEALRGKQEPVEKCKHGMEKGRWCPECGKGAEQAAIAICERNAAPQPQAQEPVAWFVTFRRSTGDDRLVVYRREDIEKQVDAKLIRSVTPLYAAPQPRPEVEQEGDIVMAAYMAGSYRPMERVTALEQALREAVGALKQIERTRYHIECPPIESLEERMRGIARTTITKLESLVK